MIASVSPVLANSPAEIGISLIVPEIGDGMGFSIFIDSIRQITSPSLIMSPVLKLTSIIFPASGSSTVSSGIVLESFLPGKSAL